MSRRAPIATLHVRNLSDRVRYEDLKRLFQKYGRVIDVTLPLDYYSRSPKGYCFVQYEDPRDAEDALYRLDRQRLYGREIEVEFARGDRKSPNEMRTRDRYPPRSYRENDLRRSRSYSRSRSRSRNANDDDRRSSKKSKRRSKEKRNVSFSRSRSRTRSNSKVHRSASPNKKSGSRERSTSPVDRSKSPVGRSPKSGNGSGQSRSRSGSPMD